MLGDTQAKPGGQDYEQPSLAIDVPFIAEELDQMIFRGPLQLKPFCDSEMPVAPEEACLGTAAVLSLFSELRCSR